MLLIPFEADNGRVVQEYDLPTFFRQFRENAGYGCSTRYCCCRQDNCCWCCGSCCGFLTDLFLGLAVFLLVWLPLLLVTVFPLAFPIAYLFDAFSGDAFRAATRHNASLVMPMEPVYYLLGFAALLLLVKALFPSRLSQRLAFFFQALFAG